ncbi:MAG: type II secretion system F family protein [Frankiales bacterium]|nr:type II secretion system F family protein [Frankiales bacterium]
MTMRFGRRDQTGPDSDASPGMHGGVALLEHSAAHNEIPAAQASDEPSRLKRILQFEITKRKVPRKELMHFSRQLAVFIKAGIPIIEAFDTVSSEVTNKAFKSVLEEMTDDIRRGLPLSDAAAAHPEAFPAFYIGILRSAEMSGQLDTVLLQLSGYIERDLEARRKVKAALIYPAVVFSMSVVTVIVLTAFVLPRFEKFFASLHAKLPLATRILLNFSHFITTWWYVIVGVLVLSIVVVVGGLRTHQGRVLRDKLYLKTPIIGDLVLYSVLERFCRILSAMTGAGVPIPDALAVTTDATNNAVFKSGLDDARAAMLRGEGLATPLAATGLFPGAANQMFRVGETTGTLETQMETAAEYYERELDYKLKSFTNLFEPAVVLFMGLVVGFVAIALVSAMYGIYRQVKV